MKIKFVINPTAGKGQALKAKQLIQNKFEHTTHFISIEETEAPGDATIIARKAVLEQYDTVVAVGGDGTVYEVINGIAQHDMQLGVIPAGTGNDFARTIGIPIDLNEAIEVILQQRTHKIDIGCLNKTFFVNVASVGFDAEVVRECIKIKKIISGPWAYVVSVFKTLINYKHMSITLSLDNRVLKREVLLVAVANGKYYGGGMMIAPNAYINDGYFDVCIINKVSKFKLLRLFPAFFKGKHLSVREVEYYKAKQVKIHAQNIIANCDGELITNMPIHFNIANAALNVITGNSFESFHHKPTPSSSQYSQQAASI